MKKYLFSVLFTLFSIVAFTQVGNNNTGQNPAFSCPQLCDATTKTAIEAKLPVTWGISDIVLQSGAISDTYNGIANTDVQLEGQIKFSINNHSQGGWAAFDITNNGGAGTIINTLYAVLEKSSDPVLSFTLILNGQKFFVGFNTNCYYTDPDCSIENEKQYVAQNGDTIQLSQNGGIIDLSGYNSTITNTITGNTIATHIAGGISQDIDESITDFGTPIVDASDPQNVAITLPYNQEGGTTQDVKFTIPGGGSAWDNQPSGTPASQASGDIQYTAGEVFIDRLELGTNHWHLSEDGVRRFYYGNGNHSYYNANGFHQFRSNNGNTNTIHFSDDGRIGVRGNTNPEADIEFSNSVANDNNDLEGTASFLNKSDYKLLLYDNGYGFGIERWTLAYNSLGKHQWNIRGQDQATLGRTGGRSGQWRWNWYGENRYNDNNPVKLIAVQADGDIVQYDDFAKPNNWTILATPTLTGNGRYTTNLFQNLETDTEWYQQRDGDMRELYVFHFSLRGSITAGTGWAWVDIPQPAGWDREILRCGTYNAVPAVDYDMDCDCHHWRNGGRVYLYKYRNKIASNNFWTEINVQYKRN